MDILSNLPPSGGYDHIITAIDVFSKYLFAYPVTRITATTVSRVIMDILCKHTYLPTTIITDLGTQFNAQRTHEVAAVLGIELKHATMKHAQTIGLLERTHASVKTHLKAATGEFRITWHKYLPLAVLNHNTTYHASLGCEPSRVFHGRIPHNILDYKLGYNPNPRYQPQTDVAEEIQKRMKILLDQTKKNIMQSYLKYKAYYDRKAKAAPLETTDYCYILNPKADTQATKIPFREFRWCGPYKVEKVLPNNNYIVRRLGTNKTQLLHRIRLRKFIPQAPLADIFVRETDWQNDDQTPIANDDLYAQSRSTNWERTRLKTGRQSFLRTLTMLNMLRFKYPKITTRPPLNLQKMVGGAQWNRPLNQIKITTITKMKFHNTSVMMMKIPKKLKKNQLFHPLTIPKKPQRIPKTPHCKKNPKIHVVKNTTYAPIPTQTTLTHTDIRTKHRQTSSFSSLFLLINTRESACFLSVMTSLS